MTQPTRSIRTAAWLGDAWFELELRRRIAQRGDYPVARLDRIRAAVSRAEAQARLLGQIEEQLEESERAVVARGRNASVRSSGRVKRDVKSYRAATAFEALVCHWFDLGEPGRARFLELVDAPLELAIDEALAASAALKRG